MILIKYQRWLWVVGAALLLLVVDIWLHRDTAEISEPNLLPTVTSVFTYGTNAEQLVKLSNYFSRFDKPVVADKDTAEDSKSHRMVGLTEEQQAQQQGLLTRLYIGDAYYELVGVVDTAQSTAIFTKRPTDLSLKSELIKLSLNDVLGGYTVTNIQPQTVYFSAGERRLWFTLFTPRSLKQKVQSEAALPQNKQEKAK